MDRRLTTILAADVVGYSRLMGVDEAGTLHALNTHRRELIDQQIAAYHGRIVKLVGDGILVEFPSVVNAVACAVEIQRGMNGRNADVPEDRRLEFRIGINLGDVIVEGDDIFGDGVNIAARLEGIAKTGGVAISGSVRDQVGSRLAFTFEDTGEQTLKNIAQPIRVFNVAWDDEPPAVVARSAPPLAVPARPSVAVLPFVNMSGDPEQEYFADGLVEDVITNLSKMPGFFVIARNSTFAYKGKSVDVRQIAKELGVRYVLEGSVRKASNRVRITGQLIEGTDATHVWADKFEGALEDIFDLQDRMTESIVGALEPTLRRAEIQRALRKRPDMLDAYDLFLRALPHAYANSLVETEKAIALLNEALRLDAGYAAAHAFVAWAHEQRFFRGGFNPDDREAAIGHADLALRVGTEDPQSLSIAAFVRANILHDYDASLRILDHALEMNPNSALALGFSSLASAFSERYERANDHALKALRLSPFDPLNYHPYLALAITYFATSRFEEAASNAALAVQSNPAFSFNLVFLVAGLARLGKLDAARDAAKRLLEGVPNFKVSDFTRGEFLATAIDGRSRRRSARSGVASVAFRFAALATGCKICYRKFRCLKTHLHFGSAAGLKSHVVPAGGNSDTPSLRSCARRSNCCAVGAEMHEQINRDRRRLLATAVTAVAAGGLASSSIKVLAGDNSMARLQTAALQLPSEGDFPPLTGATGWLNSPPLTPASLRGKVVLVEFWTYTCINWLRVHPYVRAWADKYADAGLVVIGAHAPEFPFEKNEDNVRWAVKALRVNYPVAIDSNHAIWRAFENSYWPALYFIDAQGQIRHHQFGEGDYEQSEAIIQQLLADAGKSGVDGGFVPADGAGLEAAADWSNLRSPENYLGYGRSENFVSGGGEFGEASRLRSPGAVAPQSMGAFRQVDGGAGRSRVERGWRAHRVSLSRARRSPRHGAAGARRAGAVSRAHRWSTAGRLPRSRCR